jgi:hypothetical protein
MVKVKPSEILVRMLLIALCVVAGRGLALAQEAKPSPPKTTANAAKKAAVKAAPAETSAATEKAAKSGKTPAASVALVSVQTSLIDCSLANAKGARGIAIPYQAGQCRMGGFALKIAGHDSHSWPEFEKSKTITSLSVLAESDELGHWTFVDGEVAEWRLEAHRTKKTVETYAVILQMSAFEQEPSPQVRQPPMRSELVVIKLEGAKACVVGKVGVTAKTGIDQPRLDAIKIADANRLGTRCRKDSQ